MIGSISDSDMNGNEITLYRPTEKGLTWLLQNQELLVLRRRRHKRTQDAVADDDIPF